MDYGKIIEQLSLILTELGTRECSNNSAIYLLQTVSWDEICDIGIKLFEQLKTSK